MAISTPPTKPPVPTVDVTGARGALLAAANLKGESSTMRANGIDNKKNSHNEVSPTTRIPAMFNAAHATTTNNPTITPRRPSHNQGAICVRYATNSVG